MKKWLIGLAIVIILAALATYIFIPAKLDVSQHALIRTTENGSYRAFSDPHHRLNWWPAHTRYRYTVITSASNVVEIPIAEQIDTIPSSLIIIPEGADVVRISWQAPSSASLNPIKRVQQYKQAFVLKEEMALVLKSLQAYLEKEENIYGIHVEKTIVKDTLLITTKASFSSQPTTAGIYGLIGGLQQYIHGQSANASGFPMLNVHRKDSSHFEVMVAIPIDKPIPNAGKFELKRMVPGNILVTEVQGGPSTIRNAFNLLEAYRVEHHYESPAIPFESLVTDRSREADTTKWTTRLFYPVF